MLVIFHTYFSNSSIERWGLSLHPWIKIWLCELLCPWNISQLTQARAWKMSVHWTLSLDAGNLFPAMLSNPRLVAYRIRDYIPFPCNKWKNWLGKEEVVCPRFMLLKVVSLAPAQAWLLIQATPLSNIMNRLRLCL